MFSIILFLFFLSNISFAVVDAVRSYEAGVKAYESGNYKKAIRLLENAVEAGLSGKELIDAEDKIKIYKSRPALRVNSRPKNAKVFVNTDFIANTPLMVRLLPGKYEFKISKWGYYDLKTQVEINTEKTDTLFFQLSKKISPQPENKSNLSLLLEVQTFKAVENGVNRIINQIRQRLKDKRLRYVWVTQTDGDKILVGIREEVSIRKFKLLINHEFKNLKKLSEKKINGTYTILMVLSDNEQDYIKKQARDQTLETIRYRIYQFGIFEPDIKLQDDNHISINLKNTIDAKRIIDIIVKTGFLELRLVDDVNSNSLDAALRGNIPPGREIFYCLKNNEESHSLIKVPYLVKMRTLVTGAHFMDAVAVSNSKSNESYITINFSGKSEHYLERITKENFNRKLAIIFDKNLYSVLLIKEIITDGQITISRSFTEVEAHDLSIVLRSGPLPAPVKITKSESYNAK